MAWSEWKNLSSEIHFDLIHASGDYYSIITFDFVNEFNSIFIEKISMYPHSTNGWQTIAQLKVIDNTTNNEIYNKTWRSGNTALVGTDYSSEIIDLSAYIGRSLTIWYSFPQGDETNGKQGAYLYNVNIT